MLPHRAPHPSLARTWSSPSSSSWSRSSQPHVLVSPCARRPRRAALARRSRRARPSDVFGRGRPLAVAVGARLRHRQRGAVPRRLRGGGLRDSGSRLAFSLVGAAWGMLLLGEFFRGASRRVREPSRRRVRDLPPAVVLLMMRVNCTINHARSPPQPAAARAKIPGAIGANKLRFFCERWRVLPKTAEMKN